MPVASKCCLALAMFVLLPQLQAIGDQQKFRFANIFGDGMVLQQGEAITVWGYGTPQAKVSVALRVTEADPGENVQQIQTELKWTTAETDSSGRWQVSLPSRAAGNSVYVLHARQNGEAIQLQNVLVGEVWLCSGQSNMQWGLNGDTEFSIEKESADFPTVRYCQLKQFSAEPLDDLKRRAVWRTCDATNKDLGRVSGVAYYFATRMQRYLKIPIGIVDNAIGGSMAESWTSREMLDSLPEMQGFLDHYMFTLEDWPNEKLRRLEDWEVRVEKAEELGKTLPRKPSLQSPVLSRNAVSACYNGLIRPIRHLNIRGVLFFQGENNSIGRWDDYSVVFPKMIEDWRNEFAQPEMPFGIISLYGFNQPQRDRDAELELNPPGLFFYAAIRDTHFRTHRRLKNTGLIVTTDVGDADNIHPHRKRPVGHRAARWALAKIYEKPVVHTAPTYREMEVVKNVVRLRFDLDPLANPAGPWFESMPITRNGDYRGFVIAGEDRHFYPAQVKRNPKESCLEVYSPHVKNPVAARYGWANLPDGNMIGLDHLPVHPFRTDDWPFFEQPPYDSKMKKAWDEKLATEKKNAKRQIFIRRLNEAAYQLEQTSKKARRYFENDASHDQFIELIESASSQIDKIEIPHPPPAVGNDSDRENKRANGLPDKLSILQEAFDAWLETPGLGSSYTEIKLFCELGYPDEALTNLLRVPIERKRDDSRAVELIMSTYLEHGRHDDAVNIIKLFEGKIGGGTIFPEWRNHALSKVVRFYADRNELDQAREATQQMSGSLSKESPTLTSSAANKWRGYTMIARAMAKQGEIEQAEQMLLQFRDEITWQFKYGLIKAAYEGGDRVWIIEHIKTAKLNARIKIVSSLFHREFTQGNFSAALALCNNFIDDDEIPLPVHFAKLCSACHDPGLRREIRLSLDRLVNSKHGRSFFNLVEAYLRLHDIATAVDLINENPSKEIDSTVWKSFAKTIDVGIEQQADKDAMQLVERINNPAIRQSIRYELAHLRYKKNKLDELQMLQVARDGFDWLNCNGKDESTSFSYAQLFEVAIDIGDVSLSQEIAAKLKSHSDRDIKLARLLFEKRKTNSALETLAQLGTELPSAGQRLLVEMLPTIGAARVAKLVASLPEPNADLIRIAFGLVKARRYQHFVDYWDSLKQDTNLFESGSGLLSNQMSSGFYACNRSKLLDREQLTLLREVLTEFDAVQQHIDIAFASLGLLDEALQRISIQDVEDQDEQALAVLSALNRAGQTRRLLQRFVSIKNEPVRTKLTFFCGEDQLRDGKIADATNTARSIEDTSLRNQLLKKIAGELDRPALQNARKVANWLKSIAIQNRSNQSISWGATDGSKQAIANLYSGSAGIAIFLEKLYQINGDAGYRTLCDKTNRYLADCVNVMGEDSDAGLFSGFTGVGFALLNSDRDRGNPKLHADDLRRIVAHLEKTALDSKNSTGRRSISWNGTTDVIAGTAGIGTFLIQVSEAGSRTNANNLAIMAGDGLLSEAIEVRLPNGKRGLRWMMNPEFEREMPNYSHGTAGICDFLISLHVKCNNGSYQSLELYDHRFLKAAVAGAEYLLSLEASGENSGLICHHLPDGKELFYLGWCHGPTGTVDFFQRLAKIDPDPRWNEYVERASERMLKLELHAKRYPGFWNNVGLCCGSAGVGSFFLDRYAATRDIRYLNSARRIYKDILNRAATGETQDGLPTLCWESAEHRARPDLLQTQTGLMQGAAGVGLFFLQLDAAEQGRNQFSIFGMF